SRSSSLAMMRALSDGTVDLLHPLGQARQAEGRQAPEDRKSTRLNSSHANIYTLSLHDALPIFALLVLGDDEGAKRWHRRPPPSARPGAPGRRPAGAGRSEEHTSELQSRQYLHSFPTRRSSDLRAPRPWR